MSWRTRVRLGFYIGYWLLGVLATLIRYQPETTMVDLVANLAKYAFCSILSAEGIIYLLDRYHLR